MLEKPIELAYVRSLTVRVFTLDLYIGLCSMCKNYAETLACLENFSLEIELAIRHLFFASLS